MSDTLEITLEEENVEISVSSEPGPDGSAGATGPAGATGAAGTVLPAGTVVIGAGATSPVSGALPMDGAAVSRTTYSDLFAAIGTTHGVGDGSTTFNVPDARGRALIGTGQGAGLTDRSLGDSVGAEDHTLTGNESGVAAHGHGVSQTPHSHSYAVAQTINIDPGASPAAISLTTSSTGLANANITVDSASADDAFFAHENMQPSIAMSFWITT